MDHEEFFTWWEKSEYIQPNISAIREIIPSEGILADFPSDLSSCLIETLQYLGIHSLFSHQVASFQSAQRGENLVITTGTSSGKTLCYNLPILQKSLECERSRAIYIFPTKALAHDQQKNLHTFISSMNQLVPETRNRLTPGMVAVYDGDTALSSRSAVRSQVRILITNPDMIHLGILPHHTLWQDFFTDLDFVVIDEIHLYRGVFGSHVANTLRRLKRVASFYGKNPQFFLTSATISNASAHAEKLIKNRVTPIEKDGSPHGKKHFILYNPPIINPDLGIRRSVITEVNMLGIDLLQNQIQTIIFSRSRREVEVILRNLQESSPGDSDRIRGYRAGYLAADRRRIEEGLRSGDIRLTVSTNALELGIDIGGMDAILLVGYPGSIASVRQQAGRAGRRQGSSLAVFLATFSPLDQYLVNHPEYLFERSPEQALIDPDNPLILLEHIKSAAFELPFRSGESFGSLTPDRTAEFLDFLSDEGLLIRRADRYFWMADKYPAAGISLRNASPSQVVLRVTREACDETIGVVDFTSALWMVHQGAVYLHEGQEFLVEKLDLKSKEARLIPSRLDYYTFPQTEMDITLVNPIKSFEITGGRKSYGELLVSEQVTGYKKIRWDTQEILGVEPIPDMPPTELKTTGYWFELNQRSIEYLKQEGKWSSEPNQYGKEWDQIRKIVRLRDEFTCQSCGKLETTQEFHVHHRVPFKRFTDSREANRLENLVTLCPICHRKAEANLRIRSGLSGCRYALANLAPLFLMCDLSDLGSLADPQCKFCDGQPAVIFYDQIPGGIGLSEFLFQHHDEILSSVKELVVNCGCRDGCPACVGAAGPQAEGGKSETIALLECLTKVKNG